MQTKPHVHIDKLQSKTLLWHCGSILSPLCHKSRKSFEKLLCEEKTTAGYISVDSGGIIRTILSQCENITTEFSCLSSPDGFQLNNAARQFSSLALVQNVCASVDMKEAFCLHSSSQKQECLKSFALWEEATAAKEISVDGSR